MNKTILEIVGSATKRHIESLFKPGTKITVIARTPGNNEADILVTSDSIEEIAALIERSRSREEMEA